MLATLLLAAASTVLGCTGSPAVRSASGSDYAREYRIGNYERAAREAALAPASDERASLVEGMALAELGETDRAERILSPLTRSRDREIRGRAAASLGLIESGRGNDAEAARLLQTASRSLEGSDGTWAAHYAVEAMKASGTSRPPSELVDRALPARRVVGHAESGSGFTIQFGSFSTEARARRHAQSVTRLTRSSGMADPQVEPVRRGARTLFAVRSGAFDSQSAASAVASSLNTETAVIRLQ